MPQIPNSGAISLSDFAAEFGGTPPHSMSEYYRDGGNVPSNNSNVPTSGLFRFGNMRGAINAIIQTLSNTTNVDLSTVFGSDWASSVPKEIIIPSGVTIGGTGSSDALTAPSGMGGTLTITNAGSVIGFGGTSGGNGGNAIRIASSGITVANSGLIAGGGGGGGIGGAGGAGGTGGQGRYTYVGCSQYTTCSSSSCSCSNCGGNQCVSGCSQSTVPFMDGTRAVAQTICGQLYSGGAGGAGGSGGAGGLGQGYNQSATSGSTGSAGSAGSAGASGNGAYGGTGGTGGTGGNGGSGASYGQSGSTGTSGSTGSTGANGNYTNGSAGSGGSSGGSVGAAGAAVIYTVAYTMNNTGTLAGAA